MVESKEYKKLKCLFCGYEQASSANNPRCNHCKSRRMNIISEFSAEKILNKRSESVPLKADNIKKIVGVETMEKDKVVSIKADVESKPETKKRESEFLDDVDRDILGDDDSDEDD